MGAALFLAACLGAGGCSRAPAPAETSQSKTQRIEKAVALVNDNPGMTQAQKDETIAKIRAEQNK